MYRPSIFSIEHKLTTAAAIIRRAALEAESLSDQGLADDLHALHGDLIMRVLPNVRAGKSSASLESHRA